MNRRFSIIVLLFLATTFFAACIRADVPKAGLPNPASKNCGDKGGTLSIITLAAGEAGICVFSDGSACDEWAFFRGECVPGRNKPVSKPSSGEQTKTGLANPASVNCVAKDGKSIIVQASDGSEYGVCQLPSGKICEEFAFLRGECKP